MLEYLATFPGLPLAIILFAIVFAESGLFFGFFLPGDSLLFTAGLFAAHDKISLDIGVLLLTFFVAAVLGDNVGYAFGQFFGRRFFNQPDSFFRSPEHLNRAEAFYQKYGKRTIIMARFVPAVRTFAPIAAGVSSMNYTTFIVYNVIGALLWAVGVTLAGYFLGRLIPDIDHYIIPIILFIVAISMAQPMYEVLSKHENRQAIKAKVSSVGKKKTA